MKSQISRYRIALLIAVVLNIALAAELYRSKYLANPVDRSVLTRAHIRGNRSLPNVNVIGREGVICSAHSLLVDTQPTMIVFFSSNDCPDCFSEKELWAEIAAESGIDVKAIAFSPGSVEFWVWESITGIPLDVYLDTTYIIHDAMALNSTPLKVLFTPDGEAVWADPTRRGRAAARLYEEELAYVLANLKREE